MVRFFGLAPNVILLGLVSLFNDFSSEMIYAVMPAFLVTVLAAPPIALGLIEGFADALASILKISAGWFSDRIGRRKIISVYGYTLSTATRFFLSFVNSFWQVFILRVIDRVGKGVREAPRDALLTESVGSRDLGKSFGFHRAMDTVGGILGPLAAVIILPLILFDYRRLFLIAFFAGILSIVTFIFVREAKTPKTIRDGHRIPLSFSLRKFSRSFKLFLLAVFIFGLGFMPIPLILLKAQSITFKVGAIPLMYLIYSVAYALFAIPFGKLSDRIGEKKVLALGFITAIISYAVLAGFSSPLSVILGFVILGFYSAMTDGIGRAFTSKLVPQNELATGQGFYQAAIGLSSLLAGLVGGLVWTYFGAESAFLYGALMMFVGFISFVSLTPTPE